MILDIEFKFIFVKLRYFSQNLTLYIYQLQRVHDVQVIEISRFNYQIMIKKFSKSGCNLEKLIYKNSNFK